MWRGMPADCSVARLNVGLEGGQCVSGGGGNDFLLAVNSWPDLLGRDPDNSEEWMMFNEQFRESMILRCV